jgi:hypothetical protein
MEIYIIDSSASFRCGIFFAGDKLNDKPREVLFIIPKRFPTDCSTVNQEDVKEFCLNLVRSGFGGSLKKFGTMSIRLMTFHLTTFCLTTFHLKLLK